jgi:Homeodomain-like domain
MTARSLTVPADIQRCDAVSVNRPSELRDALSVRTWNDAPSAEALDVRTATIVRVRQRFVEHGLEAALARKPQGRPSRQRKRDGRAGARLIALACSKPPEGRDEWTMQLLADTLVELQVVASVSDEAVRRTRKKTNRSPG